MQTFWEFMLSIFLVFAIALYAILSASVILIDEQVVIINNLEDQGYQNVKILEKSVFSTRPECGTFYSAKYRISVKNTDGKKEYLWGCSSPFLGTYFKVQ